MSAGPCRTKREPSHFKCKGYSVDVEPFTDHSNLPLVLRRISGTTAIEATIGSEQVLMTGPQVAKFRGMVEQVRKDGPRPQVVNNLAAAMLPGCHGWPL